MQSIVSKSIEGVEDVEEVLDGIRTSEILWMWSLLKSEHIADIAI